MKKGKYLNARAAKRANKKLVSLILALVLCIGGVVGGTLAWLTDTSEEVKNTFTPSDINITLDESDDLNLKMVPGCDITKDPVVTVMAGSEACWLFVKIEKSTNYDTYLATYEVVDGWLPLSGVDGVYYREVPASDTNQEFSVLKDNKVTVLTTVEKADMEAIDGVDINGAEDADEIAARPTLTFTAYAAQKANIADAAAAWAAING